MSKVVTKKVVQVGHEFQTITQEFANLSNLNNYLHFFDLDKLKVLRVICRLKLSVKQVIDSWNVAFSALGSCCLYKAPESLT